VQRDTTSDGMLAFGHSRSGITQNMSRSSSWQGHRDFSPVTWVQVPHAIPEQEPLSSLRFEGGNRPQRLGGAGTRDRMEFIASLTQRKSAGLSSRKSRVRTPHEAPDFLSR
jgi:hypothetical protein